MGTDASLLFITNFSSISCNILVVQKTVNSFFVVLYVFVDVLMYRTLVLKMGTVKHRTGLNKCPEYYYKYY